MGKLTSELLRGSLSTLVLSALESGSLYGYDIAKQIRLCTAGALHLKEGSLYPALHAMERDGLLSSEWVTVERGPSRKYYRLTQRGKKVLAHRRTKWREFSRAVNRVLAMRPAGSRA